MRMMFAYMIKIETIKMILFFLFHIRLGPRGNAPESATVTLDEHIISKYSSSSSPNIYNFK